jgi:hypothetical protein
MPMGYGQSTPMQAFNDFINTAIEKLLSDLNFYGTTIIDGIIEKKNRSKKSKINFSETVFSIQQSPHSLQGS